MVEYVEVQCSPATATETSTSDAAVTESATNPGPVAFLGMACELPCTSLCIVCYALPVSSLLAFRRVNSHWREVVKHLVLHDSNCKNELDKFIDRKLHRSKDQRVWVCVRARPVDEEIAHAPGTCLCFGTNCVSYVGARQGGKDNTKSVEPFFFDATFDGKVKQEDVWNPMAPLLMRSVLRRTHSCLLAYGQTGSGKTHTMFGSFGQRNKGIAFRAVHHISDLLHNLSSQGEFAEPVVQFSFLEVYNDKVHDLLTDQKQCTLVAERDVLEPGTKYHAAKMAPEEHVVAKGLSRRTCILRRMEAQLSEWLQEGAASRVVGQTVFNERSSRSHAIATLHICWQCSGSRHAAQNLETRVYLVDLAGSERAGQHALSSEQLKEGVNINKSLSTLGRVVGALARGKGEHVPYRDSALTWLLSDAIVGHSAHAFMVAAVNPLHPAETLSTLRYAQQYSCLRSDLSNRITRITAEVRELQRKASSLRNEFEYLCVQVNQQSRDGLKWNAPALKNRLVRARVRAQELFREHPYLLWSDKHAVKQCSRSAGVVSTVMQVPIPRDSEEAADGRRRYFLQVSGSVTHPQSIRVVYAGLHGRPDVALWYPSNALEDVAPPQMLLEALERTERNEGTLAQKKAQLEETKEKFAAQQQQLMGKVCSA